MKNSLKTAKTKKKKGKNKTAIKKSKEVNANSHGNVRECVLLALYDVVVVLQYYVYVCLHAYACMWYVY